MAEAVVLPVGEGAIGEQGGIATAGGRQQLGFALDMQKGVLLAGEAGLRQVLGGGTGAHGHSGWLLTGPHQAAIGRQQRRLQLWRQRSRQQQLPGRQSHPLQLLQVGGIQASKNRLQPVAKAITTEQQPIGAGGEGKATGHTHPLSRQGAQHLTKGGILAAYRIDGLKARGLQGQHQGTGIRHRQAGCRFHYRPGAGKTGLGVPKGNKRSQGVIAWGDGIEALRAGGVKAGG